MRNIDHDKIVDAEVHNYKPWLGPEAQERLSTESAQLAVDAHEVDADGRPVDAWGKPITSPEVDYRPNRNEPEYRSAAYAARMGDLAAQHAATTAAGVDRLNRMATEHNTTVRAGVDRLNDLTAQHRATVDAGVADLNRMATEYAARMQGPQQREDFGRQIES